MRLRNVLVAGAIAAGSVAGFAQVTGSGSTNTVPKFTGSSTIGPSAISEVNGNVGIGTTNPGASRLQVSGGNVAVDSDPTPNPLPGDSSETNATRYFQWSRASDGWTPARIGQTYGITYGGNLVFDLNSGGSPTSLFTAMTILQNGNVGIGMVNPVMPLDIKPDANSNWISLNDGSGHVLGSFGRSGNGLIIGTWSGGASNLILNPTGNVGIGTTSPATKLDVNGSVKISGSGASMTFPDNTVQSTAWNGTTCGGDYAESIDVTGDRKSYGPGDVLVVDPKVAGKFLKSSEPYATTVMGIYSTQPGLTGRRVGAQKTGEEVPMAMLGIVPTKVSTENGPIKPGDLLVTSSTPGYAMKATDRSRMVGALIGKALDYLDSGTGLIEVGIALQ